MASKTIVVVSDDGRLVDTTGTNRETSTRYAKLAKRLLGDDGTQATLDYGWSGRLKLAIAASGSQGTEIKLDAATVDVPGTLKVAGTSVVSRIEAGTEEALKSVKGVSGETSVTLADNPSASQTGQTKKILTVGLATAFKNRMTTVEDTLDDLFRFEEAFKVGDGLKTVDKTTYKELAVDTDTTVTQGSAKPVTSGAVYTAIQQGGGGGGAASRYTVELNSNGNMVLVDNEAD